MQLTKELELLSIRNSRKAFLYFVEIGEIPKDHKSHEYVLHHINPDWKKNDPERYIQWNILDLVPMKRVDHTKMHNTGHTVSKESREKISNSKKGRHISEEHKKKLSEYWKGKPKPPRTAEHRLHLSESHKGLISWNTGKLDAYSEESKKKMSESHKGMHWYNNGIELTQAYNCPEGWVSGRLKKVL